MIRIQIGAGYQSWMARLRQSDPSTEFGRGAMSVVRSVTEGRGVAAIPMRLLKSQGLAAHPIHEVVQAVSFSDLADEPQDFVHGIAFAELGFWKLCLEGDWNGMAESYPASEAASHRVDGRDEAKPMLRKSAAVRMKDDQVIGG